jgi:hypothetical protein
MSINPGAQAVVAAAWTYAATQLKRAAAVSAPAPPASWHSPSLQGCRCCPRPPSASALCWGCCKHTSSRCGASAAQAASNLCQCTAWGGAHQVGGTWFSTAMLSSVVHNSNKSRIHSQRCSAVAQVHEPTACARFSHRYWLMVRKWRRDARAHAGVLLCSCTVSARQKLCRDFSASTELGVLGSRHTNEVGACNSTPQHGSTTGEGCSSELAATATAAAQRPLGKTYRALVTGIVQQDEVGSAATVVM